MSALVSRFVPGVMEGLIVESGPQQGLVVELPETGIIVIGRSETCGLVLDDEKVSREHAAVVKKGRRIILRDLKSRNGTLLDGRFVGEKPLSPGDVFRVGDSRIRYADFITEEDRKLAEQGEFSTLQAKPAPEIEVVYDRVQWSRYTYICLGCLLLSAHWLFALLALGFGVAAYVEIKTRGDLAGGKATLAAVLLSLLICGYHGYEKVWTPLLQRWREQEAAQICQRNLHALYRAMCRYSIDHAGHFPEHLDDLYPRYVRKAELLCCPMAHDPIMTRMGHATSYLYFGEAEGARKARRILLMDHDPLNHTRHGVSVGRYVLYGDGTVSHIPEVAAAAILKELRRSKDADAQDQKKAQ